MRKRLNHRIRRRFWRNADGAMAVEFAIIMPVFVVMLFGTLEIGNVLFAKTTLQQGIETAGRYAMVHADATTDEILAEAVSNSSYLKSLTPTFTVTDTVIGGITYSVISVTAAYSLTIPMLTAMEIDLSTSISVPRVDPSDYG